MTHRERREARAARRREWAERSEAKSDQALAAAQARADMIPLGQPILVGHHSEARHRRDIDRIQSGYQRGYQHAEKARQHNSKAATIEAQLDRSIYSDDPDAIERLKQRIAELEAEREQRKAKNRAARKAIKGRPDDEWPQALAEAGLADALSPLWRPGVGAWAVGFDVKNLGAEIRRSRKRLEELRGPCR